MALSRWSAPLRASRRLTRTTSPLRGLSDVSAAHKASSPAASPLRATRSTEVELDQSLGRSVGATVNDAVSSCYSYSTSASPSRAQPSSAQNQQRIDHLVLHFDVNKTLVMVDTVTGKTEVSRSGWSPRFLRAS